MTGRITALAVATLSAAFVAAPAAAAVHSFDAPTATTAETEALYGLGAAAYVESATVSGGELRLDSAGNANATLTFGRLAGDGVFEFDTRISSTPGYTNVGFVVGETYFFIHPGYWGEFFRTSNATGFPIGSGSMGFTPPSQQMTHFKVDVKALTRNFTVTISSGADSFTHSFVDHTYVPGDTWLGLTVGAVNDPAHYGIFDNLSLVPVPEPTTAGLLAAGLALLALRGRRRPA